MNLIFLCHPPTLGSSSMPRFARMIGESMRIRGHAVEYWTSPQFFGRLPVWSCAARKWLGYVDQFLLYPLWLRLRATMQPRGTLFVITDHALGPWMPVLRRRPHVIHCHDFLAQRSARGEFTENPTGTSGRIYQALIRRGYRMARNFVSVSTKTEADLRSFLDHAPIFSTVVLNPLNYPFNPLSREEALNRLGSRRTVVESGFVMHVGGDQWYKYRPGVVAAYREYCEITLVPLPLLMIGKRPDAALSELAAEMPNGGTVDFVSGLSDEQVHAAYVLATVLFFPSLEEGFGWPIAEAQACGCPVITTDAEPMREVSGDAAVYVGRGTLPVRPEWARAAGVVLAKVMAWTEEERRAYMERSEINVRRFEGKRTFDRFEAIYLAISRDETPVP